VSEEPIRIKRYPNRRFYASHTSSYVSLPEIEKMVRDGMTVEIVDSQTGEDLTRSVLVQIIAERHPEKIALFPTPMLHSILRANDVMVNFLQDYFRNSLAYLDYFQTHGASGAFEQPMHWMKAWLDSRPQRPADSPSSHPARDHSPANDTGQFADRIAQLEQRIAELERDQSSSVPQKQSDSLA
jgi:polyhydroxyalkanoate synthesis repressor PhaR